MPRRACAFLLLVLFSATPRADQKPKAGIPLPPIAPLDLAQSLDLYAEGRFDEAVTRVARAGDEIGRNLRRHWAVTGRQWIDADPAHRPRRILAAAALALETEHLRAERGDWRVVTGDPPCAASCVLDWAQLQLVQRGAPIRPSARGTSRRRRWPAAFATGVICSGRSIRRGHRGAAGPDGPRARAISGRSRACASNGRSRRRAGST